MLAFWGGDNIEQGLVFCAVELQDSGRVDGVKGRHDKIKEFGLSVSEGATGDCFMYT